LRRDRSRLRPLGIGGSSAYLGPSDELDFSPTEVLLLENTLARHDAFARERAGSDIARCRVRLTILFVSHEEQLLRMCAMKSGAARR